jgi:cytochrome c peroxidase
MMAHVSPRAWAGFALALPLAALTGQDRAAHGATAFARQLDQLDALHTVTTGAVPPGVDPAFWRLFAPRPDDPKVVALGRRLYFEPQLSKDGTVACATCHDVDRSFTDLRPVSEGIGGKLGRRNSPTTMNAALIEPLFWDGRSPNLAHQAGQPVMNPIEMGMPDQAATVDRLRQTGDYAKAFQDAFGRPLDYDAVQEALAAFERTLIFLDAPFERWRAGDAKAVSAAAQAGFELFQGKARCAACHPVNATNPLGTDFRFHNIGVSARTQDFEKLAGQALAALAADGSEQQLDRLALGTDLGELGRFMVTRNYADIGAFRTPQLRNVGITPPYMHDGSMQTLWDTIDHYNRGGEVNSYLDGGIEALALTEQEIDQLVEFLFTLTDVRFAAQNARQFEQQRERARTQRPFRDVERAMRNKLVFEDRVPVTGVNR